MNLRALQGSPFVILRDIIAENLPDQWNMDNFYFHFLYFQKFYFWDVKDVIEI